MVELPEAEAVEKYEGFDLVLVRPDQHVAWRSSSDPTVADAEHVLDVVTGAAILAPTPEILIAEGLEPSALGAALLDALAQPVRSVISADGQMQFSIDASSVTAAGKIRQSRVLADGSIGASRPFAAVTASALAADPAGGVWACSDDGQRVVRIDQGGNVVATVPVEPVPIEPVPIPAVPTEDRPLRCVASDDVLVIAASGSFWRVALRD